MSKRKCYAHSLGDCSPKVTSEHYISYGVLELFSQAEIRIETSNSAVSFPNKPIPIATIAANVLCKKHNEDLSNLDVAAGKFFYAVKHCMEYADKGTAPPHDVDLLHDGLLIEKWLLKVACGSLAGGICGAKHKEISDQIVRILFSMDRWPDKFRLYLKERSTVEYKGTSLRVDLVRDAVNVDILQGIRVVFSSNEFTLAFHDYVGIPGKPRIDAFDLFYIWHKDPSIIKIPKIIKLRWQGEQK